MLLIEYVGLRNLTDIHLGRHLEYFKTLNDARVASVGFIKYNASTTRINKEKNFKIKFQVNLVFYRTLWLASCNEKCKATPIIEVKKFKDCDYFAKKRIMFLPTFILTK